MLIAFISDIHGNLPALKAAVSDAKSRSAARIICAGDITGYGPFPSEVCAYLEKSKIETISGNYDRKVLDFIENGETVVEGLQKKKRELIKWTAKNTNKATRRFLSDLPEKIEQILPTGRKLLVVHGSPVSNDDDIYPSITAAGLKIKLGGTHPDIIVCGHTHIPFVKKISGILIINCGSVGQPVDGDPSPAYALLTIDKESEHARIVRFSYNIDETIKALKKSSLPGKLQKDFAEGLKRRFLQ